MKILAIILSLTFSYAVAHGADKSKTFELLETKKAQTVKLSKKDLTEIKTTNKPEGLLIDNVRPESGFEKLGLRTGDRVISFDGRSINSPSDTMEFYNQSELNRIKVATIERDGVRQDMRSK